MKHPIILVLFLLSLTFLLGCTPQQNQVVEPKVDLCNEISNPSATISCEKSGSTISYCYLFIQGDTRVKYDFKEYGSWGALGGNANAGERQKLDSNTQTRVEIIPFASGQSNPTCYNKAITVYREQFTGDVPDISTAFGVLV